MARTVRAAFEEFRRKVVDLDADEVQMARSSRDFLLNQIFRLPDKDPDFPWLTDPRVFFGSFARRTKIQPLDDIDILVVMHGGGGYERSYPQDQYRFKVDPGEMKSPVRYLTDDEGFINSTKVLLKFRDALSSLRYYEKAEIHKRGEAVTLKLRSYPWNFDIVPAFGVTDGFNPLIYFLIPDGKGHWKRTDPRRDDERVKRINQKHNGIVLPVIRLVKYWNRKSKVPTMMSYWFETIALSIFENIDPVQTLQIGVYSFFEYAAASVLEPCPDPKNLGPNLDENVDNETRRKISDELSKCAEIAFSALIYEKIDNHRLAISEWRKIFGSEFPTYG